MKKVERCRRITEELPGSQRGGTKKMSDPQFLRRIRVFFRRINRKGHLVQVNNLNVNVLVDVSDIENIEQLIMEYNRK